LTRQRVDAPPDVGDRDVLRDGDRTGLDIQRDLGGADGHLPERRATPQRGGARPRRPHAAAAPLATGHPEVPAQQRAVLEATVAVTDGAVIDPELDALRI